MDHSYTSIKQPIWKQFKLHDNNNEIIYLNL